MTITSRQDKAKSNLLTSLAIAISFAAIDDFNTMRSLPIIDDLVSDKSVERRVNIYKL